MRESLRNNTINIYNWMICKNTKIAVVQYAKRLTRKSKIVLLYITRYCCKQEINNITANIISIDTHSRDRDYIFLIKRLQPPQLRCLRFNVTKFIYFAKIPDVCTFNA